MIRVKKRTDRIHQPTATEDTKIGVGFLQKIWMSEEYLV